MTPTRGPLACFAVAAPGLEAVVAEELHALELRGRQTGGGVDFEATPETLYRANLELRTASRVLVRVAEFRATAFYELEKRARRLPWERWLPAERPFALRVTARASRLYHEGAIEERLAAALEQAGGVPAPARAAAAAVSGPPSTGDGFPEAEEGEDSQLFVVRVLHDRVTVSADASGAPLHRRGYRQAVARAPLRETLAAAMLHAARWDPETPLLDPLCGSGTIPIEAALMARAIAPGLASPGLEPRPYAFQLWPEFDGALWRLVVEQARRRVRAGAPPILAADRDAGAIAATRANAERAGVAADLDARQQPLSALDPPARPGWLVTNPPYGKRVGESAALRDLYASLGRLARERLRGWHIALLSANRRLEGQLELALEERLRTRNGGIPVRLLAAGVP